MKPNKLTSEANVRWESSRMVLPEWRKKWLERQEDHEKYAPPLLEDQLLAEFEQMIHESMANHSTVEVVYWRNGYYQTAAGSVAHVQKHPDQIWLDDHGQRTVVPLKYLKSVSFREEEG